jgi:phosphopantetheine--protein transferase-like protein
MIKAKEIIAHFIKIKVPDIHDETIIDYTVVPSSIMLHRMYAALADNGYIVDDPASIVTFGDFKDEFENISTNIVDHSITNANTTPHIIPKKSETNNENGMTIGVDIEEIQSFEDPNNFKLRFYRDNFTEDEITYCKQGRDPRSSFAAIFSLKESIIKADNSLIATPFNLINIGHTEKGKPYLDGFSLSVSHTIGYVVSVAIKEYPVTSKKVVNVEYFSKKEVLIYGLVLTVVSIVSSILIG